MLNYDDVIDELNLNESVEILDEVYFGKQKELNSLQKLIGEYRRKYKNKFNMIGAAANTDKMLLKINREFEKFFGFGLAHLFALKRLARFDDFFHFRFNGF